ncbi:electron transfer flavoprotein subunit beta/FixA family protein [Halobacteriaceae archaeon GCM10025711]
METLACIKRVPDTGAKIVLTDDHQTIDTTSLGFTMSPHEECAVEEAVQAVEDHGGSATALTLGSEDATEQLRTALAMGVDEATLLESDDEEWGPRATARAIADAVREKAEAGTEYDLLLFGNEAADAQNYQVGVRVAHELDLPVVAGVKSLDVEDGTAIAKRDVSGGSEVYEVPLPAVFTVKEGLNTPRYPSIRGRMQAKKHDIERMEPEHDGGGLEKVRLEVPEQDDSRAEILGESPDAASDVIDVLQDLEVI